MHKQKGFSLVDILYVLVAVLAIFGVIGWVMNLFDIANTCCEITGMLVLRVIGVFIAPIGAVLGWF